MAALRLFVSGTLPSPKTLGFTHGGIVVMHANEVEAELGEAPRLLLDVLAIRAEQRPCGQIRAPEAGGRSVLEHQSVPFAPEEAALARRLLRRIQKGEIDRRDVPRRDGPVEDIGRPRGGIVQPEPLRGGRHDRHVVGDRERGHVSALPLRHLSLVEERADLGFLPALEIDRGQWRVETHLQARSAGAPPRPAAVLRQQLRLAQARTVSGEIEAEGDAATDRIGDRVARLEGRTPRPAAAHPADRMRPVRSRSRPSMRPASA